MPEVYILCHATFYIKEKIQISETLPYLWYHMWNDGVDEGR
jgi:hypothetical protein